MTKLRKLTALLLAGALTLLLLTACSGGGGSSGPEAQAEAEVMGAIQRNTSTASLKNDDGMRNIAKTDLEAKLKGNFKGYKGYHDVKYNEKTSTLTLIAQYDYKEASNLKFNLSSNWAKVGVAAETYKGKTYIAITLQVKKT